MEVELDQIGGWEIVIAIFFCGGPFISRVIESNRPEYVRHKAIPRTAQRHWWIACGGPRPRYST
jgi:hypothetical protein